MEIPVGNGQTLHVETVHNSCDKCAHCDWMRRSFLGFPTCGINGKSVIDERAEYGSCKRVGLNYQPIILEHKG